MRRDRTLGEEGGRAIALEEPLSAHPGERPESDVVLAPRYDPAVMASRTLTAAPAAAASLVAFAEHLRAGSAERLLRDVVGGCLPEGPDARVPTALVPRLLVAAIDLTSREDFPVALASSASLRRFGALGYTVATSTTLGEACTQLSRFLGIWNEGMTVHVSPDAAALELRPQPPGRRDDRGRRALLELSATALLAAVREVTGRPLTPRRLELDAASRATTALDLYAGCPVEYGAAVSRITFSAETLALPILGADPGLAEIVRTHAEERLQRVAASESWSGRARDMLVASVGQGASELADVARRLHTSKRTLQRRLAEEGTSFAELLDDVRRELAMRYLAAGALGTGEIAYLLGFAELSAFHHAFKRWTGTTPAAWRTARLAPADKTMARAPKTFILGYDGTPERFAAEVARRAPHTVPRVLETGERLRLLLSR